MLQSIGSQRVGHNFAAEQQQYIMVLESTCDAVYCIYWPALTELYAVNG